MGSATGGEFWVDPDHVLAKASGAPVYIRTGGGFVYLSRKHVDHYISRVVHIVELHDQKVNWVWRPQFISVVFADLKTKGGLAAFSSTSSEADIIKAMGQMEI